MNFKNLLNMRITGRILIVKQTIDTQHDLLHWLTQAGHQVYQTDGRQVLQDVLCQRPDLILLTIELLPISGYEICGLLKEMNSIQEIPIIFLSSDDEPLSKVQAFRFGGIDYIVTPCDPVDLLVRVETQLKIRRQQRQHQEQRSQLQIENYQLQQQILQLQQQMSELLTAQTVATELLQFLEAKALQISLVERNKTDIPVRTRLLRPRAGMRKTRRHRDRLIS